VDDGCNPSPIIVDVDGFGFSLTDATSGVVFDIFANGIPVQVAWTAVGSTNAFLVLDRNGNGLIDSGTPRVRISRCGWCPATTVTC
jgi:hypothetical protein